MFMNQPAFITLLQNAAWLLVLVVVFDLATSRQRLAGRPLRQFFTGVILGGLCMALIMTSFRLESGIIFDTRSVLLSISGLFFGPLPTLVAMFITAAFRLLKGGVGAWTGISVTFATGILGIIWGRLRRGRLQDIRAGELYALGIVTHAVMLALMLTLPWDRAIHVLHDISLPVLLIYPVAATALGLLLANRLRREQAAVDLAASEERLRLAIDAAQMGTFDFDLRSRRIVWSRKHEELWGFKPGEFAGTFESFASRVHPDDRAEIEAEMERCRDAHAPFTREFRVVWPDTSVHWMTALGQFIFDGNGHPLCFRGAVMEVTTLKQVESLRRENEERFRDMILRSPVPTGMVEADGTISLINDRFRQLFGYTVADVPTIAAWWRRAYPDEHYRQEIVSFWNAAMEKAARNHTVAEPQEFVVTCKDGSRRVVEIAGRPFRGGVMCTFIDVTDRHKAEQKLYDSEERLRLFIEHAPAALAMFDRDMRYLAVSRRWLTDYGLEGREILGRLHYDIFPEIGDGLKQVHRRGLAGEVLRGDERRFERADGSVQYLRWEMHPWRDSRGEVGGIVIFTEDVTRRRETEETLRQSEAHLSTALDMAQAGYWEYDIASDTFTFNDHFYRIFKTTAAAVGGYQMSSAEYAKRFCHPDDAAIVAREIEASSASSDPLYCRQIEHRIRCGDGSEGFISVRFFVVKDAQGRTVKTYGVNQNITERKRIERFLREASAYHRRLIEASLDPLVTIGPDGRITDVNAATEAVTGRKRQDLIGTDFAEYFLEPERARAGYRKVLAEGLVRDYPLTIRHVSGHTTDVLYNASVYLDAAGLVQGVFAAARDMTERNKAEQALRDSEEKFAAAFHASPNLMAITRLADGSIVDVNESYSRLLGYSREESLARTTTALSIWADPADRDTFVSRLRESGRVTDFETKLRRKDGTEVPVLDSAQIISLRGEWCILSVAHDVSERKKAEESLRQSREILQAVLNAIPVRVFWKDRNSVILGCNTPFARDAGFEKPEDLVGKDDFAMVWRDQAERYRADDRAVIESGKPKLLIEEPQTTPAGKTIYLLTSKLPLRNADGTISGVLGTYFDITDRKQAEQKLHDSEERLRLFIEHAPAALAMFDRDLRYLAASRRWLADYGLEGREIFGCSHYDIFPEIGDDLKQVYRRGLAGEVVRGDDHRFIRADGSIQYVRWEMHPWQDSRGAVGGIVIFTEDITERKQAEEQLRDTEIRRNMALEAARMGTWELDLATNHSNWSAEQEKLFGFEPGTFPGTVESFADRIHPDDYANMKRTAAAALKTRQPFQFESRVTWPDGSLHWLATRAQYFFDSSGTPVRMTGVAYEITERKQAEEALQESEIRFRTLVDGAPEGIFVQADDRFQYVNPAMARLLGAGRPEDLVGRDILTLIAPEFHAAVRDRIQGQLETGTAAAPMEQEYLRLDGARVPVETTAMPVRFGNRDAHLVFVRDISERKRIELEKQNLQAQLAQVQKMDSIGRLAGGVAHDFNNMLGVILGHADLALEKLTPDRPCYSSLQEIRKAAMRSGDLTRQLLAFARKQTVAPRVLDLNETIEGMLKMLRRLIGENIELNWHPGHAPATIKMDPSQIDQVLANLCVNARDAINDTGRITIKTEPAAFDADFCATHPGYLPGDYVMLAVSDNGCGMDSETLLRLFEPFFTTKEVGKGTGLGLATVYGIVKQNNGFIHVYSEPGQGSTFKIHLPRHAPAEAAVPATPAPPARGTETILLVEDELALLTMTRLMLEQFGYRVLPAATPTEALRLAAQNAGQIQLLMTDVVMPEMNGRELAKVLLADNPGLKRLFMSGYTTDVIAHQGVLDPDVHFLPKPFTPAELAAKIREALAPGTAAR